MLQKLNFKPGFNKQDTESGAEGQWTDGDFVRFRYGLPEKIGGWLQLTAGGKSLPGAARAQVAFSSFAGEKYAAIGTSQGLFLYYGNDFYDISPLDTAITGCTITTVNNSNVITINKGSHNLAVGRYITLSGVTVTGASGYTAADLQKVYEILTVPDVDKFTIQAASVETGSGMTAAGAATVNPYVEVGPTIQTTGYGWGTSTWNTETWNTPRSSSSVTLNGRDWSIDNFGELMIATALDGSTFQWSPTSDGLAGKASAVTGAPTASKFSLVSTPDRHLILFGTEKTIGTGGSQDPLLLRFSSQEDINTYEPRSTNTAGSLRIQDGSTIIGADKARGQILVWTDTSLHGLQFIGPPFTFGLSQLGKNCGLLGQHAAVVVRDVSYWMGQNAFFVFDGTVKKLPCSVDDFVFENIDLTQTDQIFAGVNTEFAEIIWFYVTNPDNSTNPQINKCVIYNYLEQSWAVGTLNRTSWVDRGVFSNPLATEYLTDSVANATPTVIGLSDGVSRYYRHEFGTDGDGSAIQAFIQSGDFNIDEGGEQLMRIARFIPDFRDQTGNVSVTFSFKNYPYGNVVSQTATTVQTTDIKKDLRGRGRQANFKVESNVSGGNFKMGTFTIDAYPDGGR